MLTNKPPVPLPIWMDDPALPLQAVPSKNSFFRWLPFSIGLFVRVAILIIFIIVAFRIPLVWIFVVYEAGMIALRLFIWKRSLKQIADPVRLQQSARVKTGASHIGSALHTAGHPLLQVGQPVVLALVGAELSIYSYSSPVPIDTLAVKDILSVDTVVYDDENVPHLGVLDSTARALQVTFLYHGQPCTCSFRRMAKLRPVDWYQAIQAARLA